MSDIATELVWSQSKSCRGSRLVMLALAREADDDGKATLTLEEISTLTRLTPRSITKCLGELAKLGELSHERGGGASNPNAYSILLCSNGVGRVGSEKELPTPNPEDSEEGTRFQELPPRTPLRKPEVGSFSTQTWKFLPRACVVVILPTGVLPPPKSKLACWGRTERTAPSSRTR